MPQTPLSNSSSYATPQDFINRYDVRTVGDLLSDSDTDPRLSPAEVLASTKLQALLDDAAGEIDSATVVGQRYLPTDLTALTGTGLAMLVGLNCALCLGKLLERRPDRLPIPQQVLSAQNKLEQLRQGERIFPTVEVSNAGKAVPTIDPPPIPGKMFWTEAAWPYFGPLLRPQFGGQARRGRDCDC